MPKKLPLTDLRARRSYLTNADYAYSEGPEYKPSGHIDKEVWDSLTALPDNALLITTDAFSRALATLEQLCSSWRDISEHFAEGSPLFDRAFSALESFEGATFSAATGWYRIAGIVLRCALEDVLIGLYYQTRPEKKSEFEAIVQGDRGSPSMRTIFAGIKANHPESAKRVNDAAKLYAELSIYVHRIANNFIVASNGPIFFEDAFNKWIEQTDRTYQILCGLIDVVIAKSKATEIAKTIRFKKQSEV